MPSGRSRDDDESDLPRRRDRDGDRFDDRPDDRPRSRRDDDYDDRPRRRYEDDDRADDRPRRRDDYDRPRRPRPRPRRKGSNVGLWVGLGVGGLVLMVLVVVLAVVLGGGLFGSSVDYAKFKAISGSDTLAGLEKRFGKASKMTFDDLRQLAVDAQEPGMGDGLGRGKLPFAGGGFGGRAVPQVDPFQALGIEMYQWRSGSVRVIVVVGPKAGGKGLVSAMYLDTDALRKNRGVTDPAKMHNSYEFRTL